MRKFWMRMICLLLCLALSLGGSAVSEGKVAMGRYVEQPLVLPGEGNYLFAQAGSEVYALESDLSALSVSNDGRAWTPRESGHDPAVCPIEYVRGFSVGADGGLYLASGTGSSNSKASDVIVERILGGKAERVTLDLKADEQFAVADMAVTASGDLVILDGLRGARVLRFAPDGKLQMSYGVHGGTAIAVCGRELAVHENDAQQVTLYDIESGEQLRKFPAPEGADYSMPLAYGQDGTLYMATKAGIFTVTAGGTLMTQMLDGNLTSLSKPSLIIGDLLFGADGDPMMLFVDNTTWQYSLFGYRFDASMPTEPTTQISVFALYDSAPLREAVALVQAQNPEAKVNLTVALTEGTAITRDDAIRTLNTEILAGKGPDVIMLDGLPVQSYIDKGVLLDLSEIIKPLIDEGKLLKNVAGAFDVHGAITAVPTRFMIPTLWGDLNGIESLADIAEWAAQNPDALPTYFVEAKDLIDEFFLSCAPAWRREDGRLDERKLAEFLSDIKAIRGNWNDEKVVSATNFDYRALMAEMARPLESEWNPYLKSYERGLNTDIHSLVGVGKMRWFPYVLRGMENATAPNGVIVHDESLSFAPMPGQGPRVYLPNLVLGVNAGTGNAELAKKFVLAMLSDEVQTYENTYDSHGFPISEAALAAALASTQTATGGVLCWDFEGVAFGATWLDEGQRQQLRGIIDALDTPSLPDFTLHQMVIEQSAPFFEGNVDAEQAAATIAAKANTYLSE